MTLPDSVHALAREALPGDGPVLFLTGAGISAESGIPTFRGPEGYWRIGSRNWHPQELATHAAFESMPDEVWGWYLYRRGVCRAAEPNAAHRALAEAEATLGDRFLLVTQNVDGLHLRAGNTLARTYQIHGNIDFMRCRRECGDPVPIGEAIPLAWEKGRTPGDAERRALTCPRCGEGTRPHVLWFDESYDERRYRWESSIRAASTCALLVVVGTSGATNLPMRIAEIVTRRGVPMIVLNPEESPFTALASTNRTGAFVATTAGAAVPELVASLVVEG